MPQISMSSAPAGFKSCSFCAVPGISHDLGGSFMVMACAELVLLRGQHAAFIRCRLELVTATIDTFLGSMPMNHDVC